MAISHSRYTNLRSGPCPWVIEPLLVSVADGLRARDSNRTVKERAVRRRRWAGRGLWQRSSRGRAGRRGALHCSALPVSCRAAPGFTGGSQQRLFRSAAQQRSQSCAGSLREARSRGAGAPAQPGGERAPAGVRAGCSTETGLRRGRAAGAAPGCQSPRPPRRDSSRSAQLRPLGSAPSSRPGSPAARPGHAAAGTTRPGAPAAPAR